MAGSRFGRMVRAMRAGTRRSGSAETDMQRTARDIVGPLGWASSPAYKTLAENMDRYRDSFDDRLPPSLHVSERDRVRRGDVIPLRERCIEDLRPAPTAGPTPPTSRETER